MYMVVELLSHMVHFCSTLLDTLKYFPKHIFHTHVHTCQHCMRFLVHPHPVNTCDSVISFYSSFCCLWGLGGDLIHISLMSNELGSSFHILNNFRWSFFFKVFSGLYFPFFPTVLSVLFLFLCKSYFFMYVGYTSFLGFLSFLVRISS